jgi:hypothetical protein
MSGIVRRQHPGRAAVSGAAHRLMPLATLAPSSSRLLWASSACPWTRSAGCAGLSSSGAVAAMAGVILLGTLRASAAVILSLGFLISQANDSPVYVVGRKPAPMYGSRSSEHPDETFLGCSSPHGRRIHFANAHASRTRWRCSSGRRSLGRALTRCQSGHRYRAQDAVEAEERLRNVGTQLWLARLNPAKRSKRSSARRLANGTGADVLQRASGGGTHLLGGRRPPMTRSSVLRCLAWPNPGQPRRPEVHAGGGTRPGPVTTQAGTRALLRSTTMINTP